VRSLLPGWVEVAREVQVPRPESGGNCSANRTQSRPLRRRHIFHRDVPLIKVQQRNAGRKKAPRVWETGVVARGSIRTLNLVFSDFALLAPRVYIYQGEGGSIALLRWFDRDQVLIFFCANLQFNNVARSIAFALNFF